MDCADVQAELIPYHLGTLEEAAADAMDAHLLTCAACLRGYLQRTPQGRVAMPLAYTKLGAPPPPASAGQPDLFRS